MKLSFRNLAILIALLFGALSLTWMFAPQRLLTEWGITLTLSAAVVGRRAAAFYAGVAVMFWFARNAGPSPARAALIKGLVVTCLISGALGVFELAVGHAEMGILVAVAIEVSLTLALLHVNRTQSNTVSHRVQS